MTTEENLYHVKRTIIDFYKDVSGATQTTDILGTYTSLPAAKAAAQSCLGVEGYKPSDFTVYKEKEKTSEDWPYGDGVLVYAKDAAKQEFRVSIDTKPNETKLKGNAEGKVEGHLHYVLQTKIDYYNDRSGALQTTEVEGTYLLRKDAYNAAPTVLLDKDMTKKSFVEYDEQESYKEDWPYGENVVVHAVGRNGENFIVSVKTDPIVARKH
jgi:hypothetical protein